MASFLMSSSRFEHAEIVLRKATEQYENLRTFAPATLDQMNKVAANNQFLGYVDSTASGSALAVFSLTSYGKNHIPVHSPAYQLPLIRAHSQSIQDFQFHPFLPNLLYSVSTDKYAKLWKLPVDGLTVDMTAAEATLQTKSKSPLRGLATHHIVGNLLAVRSSRELSLFDLTQQKEIFTSQSNLFAADLLSMNWSFDGQLLVSTTKNKKLQLLDPRTGTVINEVDAHSGVRYSSTTWLGNEPFLLSTGHNSLTQQREMYLWDSRNLDQGPVKKHSIDKEEGALLAQFDVDTQLLLLSGKGDKSIRLYHVDASQSEDPIRLVHTSSPAVSSSTEAVRGLALLPKAQASLGSGEILRFLKLSDGLVQSYSVDASNVTDFDASAPVKTSLFVPGAEENTVERWLAGEVLSPTVMEIIPSHAPKSTSPLSFAPVGNESEVNSVGNSNNNSEPVTPNDSNSPNKRASSRIASGLGSVLKYRHMHGREAVKTSTYYNLQPDLSASDSPIVAANETFFALPYRGGGGPVYVSTHSNTGKVLPDCTTLNGHKSSVVECAFAPLQSAFLATGSMDCTIKLWDLNQAFPESESNASGLLVNVQPVGSLSTHANSIRTLQFHPLVNHLLVSAAQDSTIRFHDTQECREISCFKLMDNCPSASSTSIDHSIVNNLTFNSDGTSMAIACKDRNIRWVDPRQSKWISSTNYSQSQTGLGRNLRVTWCTRSNQFHLDPLISVSSGSHGLRQLALWDIRNLSAPTTVKTIDNASGQLFPLYDEGLQCLFVAGKGDTIVRVFELANLEAAVEVAEEGDSKSNHHSYLLEKCSELQTNNREPFAGICLLPKRVCDVRSIEVARVLKLTSEAVVPLTFHVPRAEHLQSYFHDDIYPPIRAKYSEVTIDDWQSAPSNAFGESNPIFQPVFESLQPLDMVKISERPVEPTPSAVNSKIEQFKQQMAKDQEAQQAQESAFARMQQYALQNAQYNRNLSGPVKIGGVVVSHPEEESDSDNDWDD